MPRKKMTVLILSKQTPTEYETSRLIASFANKGITAIPTHPDNYDIIVNKDIRSGVKYKGQDLELPQLVLGRIGAGILPFQLAVLRHFEQIGIYTVNCSESIEIVKDKLRSSQILSRHGIPTPNTMMVRFPIDVRLVESNIGFPCVVKVVTGSYGEGVYLCERKRDFTKLMEFIDNLGNKKQKFALIW
jgi:glutathione synthase/RimK-type ligase-like ATP-grasp enzyme